MRTKFNEKMLVRIIAIGLIAMTIMYQFGKELAKHLKEKAPEEIKVEQSS